MRPDPMQMPEWKALSRECSQVRQLIGAGITALGKANYADGKGEYYIAFYGLSLGIERLAKLILVADYVLNNKGAFPTPKQIKNFGHQLVKLIDEVKSIASRHSITQIHGTPSPDFSAAILNCLDSFADAGRGRYANFSVIGDPNFNEDLEPIKHWYDNVADLILSSHHNGKTPEKKIAANAQLVSDAIGDYSSVLFIAEDGKILSDIKSASIRTGQSEILQKFGRFYTLQIVRWLSDIFIELTDTSGYKDEFAVLFGHYEFFQTYSVEDKFLLTRKVWPLT